MEREIKFKYYFLFNKKVINTKTFIMDDIEDINFNTLLFLNIDCNKNNFENMELHRSQYTGLIDKNGVEIYKGDIIKDKFGIIFGVVKYGRYKLSNFTKHDNQHHHIGFYVEKDKFNIQSLEEMCWYINESGNPIKTNNIEVVGNIHEDSHLLDNN